MHKYQNQDKYKGASPIIDQEADDLLLDMSDELGIPSPIRANTRYEEFEAW